MPEYNVMTLRQGSGPPSISLLFEGAPAVAARKQALTVYIMPGFSEYGLLMDRLGKYKTRVSCPYIKKLKDVDLAVLAELSACSVADMWSRYLGNG